MTESTKDKIKKYRNRNRNRNSNFYNIYKFLLNSEYIKYTFEENFTALANCIKNYEEEIYSKDNNPPKVNFPSKKSKEHLKNFIKNLHNYSTSVNSTEKQYDHFFKTKTKISTNSERKYFEKIKKDPLHLFVIALRHYIAHASIPPITISIHQTKKEKVFKEKDLIFISEGKFKINKNVILQKLQSNNSFIIFKDNSKKRTILSKYLKKERKDINLKNSLDKHFNLFSDHIDKTNKKIKNIDKEEYLKIKKLHQEITEEQKKV
ncbi:MAG: hypothetical protein ACOCRX_09960 [Candidatus Woesearchaeota archaeon]